MMRKSKCPHCGADLSEKGFLFSEFSLLCPTCGKPCEFPYDRDEEE